MGWYWGDDGKLYPNWRNWCCQKRSQGLAVANPWFLMKEASPAYGIPYLRDTPLRYVVGNHQLRTVGHGWGVAAEKAEIVGNGIVIVIQFEAQANLGQAAAGG